MGWLLLLLGIGYVVSKAVAPREGEARSTAGTLETRSGDGWTVDTGSGSDEAATIAEWRLSEGSDDSGAVTITVSEDDGEISDAGTYFETSGDGGEVATGTWSVAEDDGELTTEEVETPTATPSTPAERTPKPIANPPSYGLFEEEPSFASTEWASAPLAPSSPTMTSSDTYRASAPSPTPLVPIKQIPQIGLIKVGGRRAPRAGRSM